MPVGRAILGTVCMRTLLLALLWWALAGDAAWGFGAPVILVALGASIALQPARRVRLEAGAMVRFAAFFLVQSVRAGIDVAARALSLRPSLAPALLDYRLRLPPGAARVFLADTVSLLPGTLSAELVGDLLRVHVLDARMPVEQGLRAAETRVAALFGATLSRPAEGR